MSYRRLLSYLMSYTRLPPGEGYAGSETLSTRLDTKKARYKRGKLNLNENHSYIDYNA